LASLQNPTFPIFSILSLSTSGWTPTTTFEIHSILYRAIGFIFGQHLSSPNHCTIQILLSCYIVNYVLVFTSDQLLYEQSPPPKFTNLTIAIFLPQKTVFDTFITH